MTKDDGVRVATLLGLFVVLFDKGVVDEVVAEPLLVLADVVGVSADFGFVGEELLLLLVGQSGGAGRANDRN